MFSRTNILCKWGLIGMMLIIPIICVAGCGKGESESKITSDNIVGNELTGTINIDGSSTVFPITEAVAEEFQKVHRKVRITIGISGTGGGFKKFGNGEMDINNASRTIKPSERELCAKNGVEYIELPVAYDGLAVVINPKNDWVDRLTVEELKLIWESSAQEKITKWKHVRSIWPDKEIRLYGPGVDSGTFDYFTEVINGKSGASRGDFTASEDDNVLVLGVANDIGALGYFGFAYYEHNKDKLKIVPIDNGKETVSPDYETITDGRYSPLSRKIFIYINKKALQERSDVREFVKFYMKTAPKLVREVGYIALPSSEYETEF